MPQPEWTQIPTFGGGLNFSAQPSAIDETEWSWCDGFFPDEQSALPLPYYRVLISANYFSSKTPGQVAFGILPNPFSVALPLLILTYETGATDPAPVHFYNSDGSEAGTVELAWDGVAARPTRYQAHRTAPQAAFLDGWLVITCGSGDAGYSMLRWNGVDPWKTLIPKNAAGTADLPTFRCAHLESFGGFLIGACWGTSQTNMRMLRVSSASSTTVWMPNFDNSADMIVLDDSMSGITGIGMLNQNSLGIFTRAGLYGLTPTGNIPPFTRSYIGMFPAADAGIQGSSTGFYAQATPLIGATPYGLAHVGYSDVYMGTDTAVGTKVWRYLSYQGDPPQSVPPSTPRLIWHHRLRALLVPTIAHEPPKDGFFYFNPISEGWGWQSSQYLGLGKDQALIFLGTAGAALVTWTHVTLAADGSIWGEFPPLTPRPGIFVDSKDFMLPADRYVDAVKVDWEALFPSSVLQVTVIARPGLQGGLPDGQPTYGTVGFAQDLSALFDAAPGQQTHQMPPGSTESSLRARGKLIRFRFKIVAGLGRIRGFAFRTILATDRRNDMRQVIAPANAGYWDVDAWDRSAWSAYV